jgi:hypothetical protein
VRHACELRKPLLYLTRAMETFRERGEGETLLMRQLIQAAFQSPRRQLLVRSANAGLRRDDRAAADGRQRSGKDRNIGVPKSMALPQIASRTRYLITATRELEPYRNYGP